MILPGIIMIGVAMANALLLPSDDDEDCKLSGGSAASTSKVGRPGSFASSAEAIGSTTIAGRSSNYVYDDDDGLDNNNSSNGGGGGGGGDNDPYAIVATDSINADAPLLSLTSNHQRGGKRGWLRKKMKKAAAGNGGGGTGSLDKLAIAEYSFVYLLVKLVVYALFFWLPFYLERALVRTR